MSDKINYIPKDMQSEFNINDLLHTDHMQCNGHMLFKELTDEDIDTIEAMYVDENGYLNPPF